MASLISVISAGSNIVTDMNDSLVKLTDLLNGICTECKPDRQTNPPDLLNSTSETTPTNLPGRHVFSPHVSNSGKRNQVSLPLFFCKHPFIKCRQQELKLIEAAFYFSFFYTVRRKLYKGKEWSGQRQSELLKIPHRF